jgi:lysophospholipase L1-like esterase
VNTIYLIAKVVLIVAFLASVGLNFYLYAQRQDYERQLGETRLDPFGLNRYPSSAKELKHPVIVFFGDSRAADWPAPEYIKYATFVNRGMGNQTTAQVLGRFEQHIASLEPKVIVIQVGGNDLRKIALFPEQKEMIIQNCKANIKKIVDLSTKTEASVVLTTIFPVGNLPIVNRLSLLVKGLSSSEELRLSIKNVNAYIKTLASNNVKVFDTSKVLSNSNEMMVYPQYARDYLHLNREGYAALNKAMVDMMVVK